MIESIDQVRGPNLAVPNYSDYDILSILIGSWTRADLKTDDSSIEDMFSLKNTALVKTVIMVTELSIVYDLG